MRIYFDNAATTPLAPEVIDAMLPFMRDHYGNPSSIHQYGRYTKSAIEKARRSIAGYLNASPSEIIFTSGGTEANNLAITSGVASPGITHFVSSPIEHHAVIHTIEHLAKQYPFKASHVRLLPDGHIDMSHLEQLLSENPSSMVSLMHANNEIGNLLDIERVGDACKKHKAIFHSDTVQTMGHYLLDVPKIKAHFVTCSAHKFHGPKGIGFLYVNNSVRVRPLIYGGSQERNMRAGTENVPGIIGMAKAFELAYSNLEKEREHILHLKMYMMQELEKNFKDIRFNSGTVENGLYTVVNVTFPLTDISEMLIYHLDMCGIAASGGSACSSGVHLPSHVLNAIYPDSNSPSVRFSFSKYNTIEEVDCCIRELKQILR